MKRNNSRTAASVMVASVLLALSAGAAAGDKIEIEIYCPSDVDVFPNGAIDAFDLMVVADVFGECDTPCTVGATTATSSCTGDVNGNCYVGTIDLAYMMGYLGTCGCLGDVNGNGELDDDDLTTLCDIQLPIDCRGDVDDNGRIDRYDELAVDLTLLGDEDGEVWWTIPQTSIRVNRADVNGDDAVDSKDLDLVRAGIGQPCRGDVNHDGWIDDQDVAELEELLGSACP